MQNCIASDRGSEGYGVKTYHRLPFYLLKCCGKHGIQTADDNAVQVLCDKTRHAEIRCNRGAARGDIAVNGQKLTRAEPMEFARSTRTLPVDALVAAV